MFGRADRTVWLDGSTASIRYAEHTWDGFSTGTFHDGELTVTTTHMTMGVLQKVGVYRQSLRGPDRALLPAWAVSDDGQRRR